MIENVEIPTEYEYSESYSESGIFHLIEDVFAQDYPVEDPECCDKDINDLPLLVSTYLPSKEPVEEYVERKEREEVVIDAILNRLNPKERVVVIARYGFFGTDPMTYKQISEHFKQNISGEYYRQVHERALNKIRHAFVRGYWLPIQKIV